MKTDLDSIIRHLDRMEFSLDLNWADPGGHRIWLVPERDFFISDLKHPFDKYDS